MPQHRDDFAELYRRIKEGEGEHQDFKQHVPAPARIARTLVAFANHEGGSLLIGVDDQGEITGVDPAQEKHVLIKAARKHCDPPIFLHFDEWQAKGKRVLEARIKASKQEHRALDEAGRWLPFIRVADESVLAPGAAAELAAAGQSADPIPILMAEHQGLVNYLEDHDQISIKEYMQLMQLPYPVAARSLEALAESGVLDRDEMGGRAWYFLAPGC
jgi:hypothetical protein